MAVVGWWATWAAEQVRGVVVSDALAPQLTRPGAPVPGAAVSPPAWLARATQAVVQPSALTYADLSAYVPLPRTEYDGLHRALAGPAPARYQNRLAHLAVIMAATRTYAAVAEELLRTERPDLVAVYLEAIDTISHLFVRDRPAGPRAITRAYQDADALIRRLAEASPPDTLVVFGLLGPNGAGKTTTIRIILDIFKPDHGTVSILDGAMSEAKKARIGYIPEERGLYQDIPLERCLLYLASLKNVPEQEARSRLGEYLERFDLAEHKKKKVKELSKGMQ